MIRKRRLLLTGASGFLGKNTLAVLAGNPDLEIHVAGRHSPALSCSADYSFHHIDLLHRDMARQLIEQIRPSDLLCLAWCAEPKTFWTDPLNHAWQGATQALIETFYQSGGKHATVAGSGAEYNLNANPCIIEIDTPTNPTTIYGQSKNTLREWLETEMTDRGLGWTWGRIFWTFGPYEPPEKLVTYVIQRLLHDEIAEIKAGREIRDFLYAANIGSAFAHLVKHRSPGIYNIASGEGVAVRDLVTEVANLMGKLHLLKFAPLTHTMDFGTSIVPDNRRLLSLGWKPRDTRLEALQKTIHWNRSLDLS